MPELEQAREWGWIMRTGQLTGTEARHSYSSPVIAAASLSESSKAYSLRVTTWWKASWRRWAALAAIVGFVMAAVYLALIASEGNNSFGEVALWVLAMLVAAALSLIADKTEVDQRARMLLFVSAAIFLAIGVVSIFSLGLGFLVAGAMAVFGANEMPRSSRT